MRRLRFGTAWRGADKTGRLEIYVEPRDVWVGVYVAPDAVYVCPLPLLVLRWARADRIGGAT